MKEMFKEDNKNMLKTSENQLNRMHHSNNQQLNDNHFPLREANQHFPLRDANHRYPSVEPNLPDFTASRRTGNFHLKTNFDPHLLLRSSHISVLVVFF